MLTNLQQQKDFFYTGVTKTKRYRIDQLKKLKNVLLQNENKIYESLYTDLKKSKEEIWVTELGIVLNEIKYAISNLENWMAPERVRTNFANFPSKSYIYKEPLGLVLIIAPWNYPLQLLFNPLVGAIAAGNCVVLKGSEHASATDALMHNLITTNFNPNYISYYQGDGATVVPQLIKDGPIDHIFYTGSTAVGKLIYKMAAEKLIPVTLELGGKSPCVVTASANIKKAAKRIAVTKFSNCGQMCVAPDYILVHQSKKQALVSELKTVIEKFYTTDASQSYNYGKIINERQWQRIVSYLNNSTIAHGGKHDIAKLYIEPTLLIDIKASDTVMQVEIFGPILPILTYDTPGQAMDIINQNPNPLAFYVFTKDSRNEKFWLENVAFGGGCVNNASWHLTNHHLPFGGRGFSGMGAYHGKFSFDVFTHKKTVMKTPNWFDPFIKYPPFNGRLNIFKWLIR